MATKYTCDRCGNLVEGKASFTNVSIVRSDCKPDTLAELCRRCGEDIADALHRSPARLAVER